MSGNRILSLATLTVLCILSASALVCCRAQLQPIDEPSPDFTTASPDWVPPPSYDGGPYWLPSVLPISGSSSSSSAESPLPNCPWARGRNETSGLCERWVDQKPGRNYRWSAYAVLFIVFPWIMATLGSTYIINCWRRFMRWTPADRAKVLNPWIDPKVIGAWIMVVGFLLMGFSNIDPWAFFGTYTIGTFLYMYAPGYGMILTHPSFFCLAIINEITLMRRKSILIDRKIMQWVVGIMFLMVAFATLGYIGFGLALAKSFQINPDPNSPLALKGDYLVYTLYGVIIVFSCTAVVLVCILMGEQVRTTRKALDDEIQRLNAKIHVVTEKRVPSNSKAANTKRKEIRDLEAEKTRSTRVAREKISKARSIRYRTIGACFGYIIVAITFLVVNVERYRLSTEQGVDDHIDFHYTNRLCETALGLITFLAFMEGAYDNAYILEPLVKATRIILCCVCIRGRGKGEDADDYSTFKYMDNLDEEDGRTGGLTTGRRLHKSHSASSLGALHTTSVGVTKSSGSTRVEYNYASTASPDDANDEEDDGEEMVGNGKQSASSSSSSSSSDVPIGDDAV